jgi:hypothetical protein
LVGGKNVQTVKKTEKTIVNNNKHNASA